MEAQQQNISNLSPIKLIEPEMVLIKRGKFIMGSPDGIGSDYERPRNPVMIAKDFKIGKYPVTRGEFAAFVNDTNYRTTGETSGGIYCYRQHREPIIEVGSGETAIGVYVTTEGGWEQDANCNWQQPGFTQDDNHPVVGVSYDDAKNYCQWLSKQTGRQYRLPSEAEWEFSCRAGSTSQYSFGNDASKLGEYAWYWDNSGKQTQPVGKKKSNAWGLYDMHGNVWERCEDCWHKNYDGASSDGSAWLTNCDNPSLRMLRGGSWYNSDVNCRSASRNRGVSSDYDVGFRVCCEGL